MSEYLVLFAIVLAVNLLPAFGPPTWSIIAFYGLSSDLPLVGLIAVGALAAALGRLLLALAARTARSILPRARRANLEAARELLARQRSSVWLGLGLFALSPLPSGQLFLAAGLTRVPLLAFTAAFFCGRIVSYSVYGLSARSLRDSALGATLRASLADPVWIALQVGALALVAVLVQVDWIGRLGRKA